MAMHIANDPPPVSPVRPVAPTRPARDQDQDQAQQQAKASARAAPDDTKPSASATAKAADAQAAAPKRPEEPKDNPKPGSPASNSAMAQLSRALENGDLDAVEQAFQALRLRRSSANVGDPLINEVA